MSPFLKGTQNLGKKGVQQINCKNAFLPSYYEKNAFHKILGKCSSILIYLHCSEMFEFSRQKSYFASVDFLFHICYILLRFCPHPSPIFFLQTKSFMVAFACKHKTHPSRISSWLLFFRLLSSLGCSVVIRFWLY